MSTANNTKEKGEKNKEKCVVWRSKLYSGGWFKQVIVINNLSASPEEKEGGKEEEVKTQSVWQPDFFVVFSRLFPQVHEQSCHTLTLPLCFSCSGGCSRGW